MNVHLVRKLRWRLLPPGYAVADMERLTWWRLLMLHGYHTRAWYWRLAARVAMRTSR